MLRACLMMALWISVSDVSIAAAPAPYPMVVVFNTTEGGGHGILPPPVQVLGRWQRLQDLAAMLGTETVSTLASLAVPATCGEVGRSNCTELNITTDEQLLQTIEQLHAPQVLVSRPMAGAWTKEQAYHAWLEVTLIQTEPTYARLRSFEVYYHESQCDRTCVAVAHRYAAEEFRDMITYMLSVEFNDRPDKLPPSWQDKPKLKHVSRWANSCLKDVARNRLVRDDRDRAWLGQISKQTWPNVRLSSLSWTGCTR